MGMPTGYFQKCMAAFAGREGEHLCRALEVAAARVCLPDDGFGEWGLDEAVSLYVNAEGRNDYFLLHCVTCAFFLDTLLRFSFEARLDSASTQNRAAVSALVRGVIATYVAHGSPRLCPFRAPDGCTW